MWLSGGVGFDAVVCVRSSVRSVRPTRTPTEARDMSQSVILAVLGLSLGLVAGFPQQLPDEGKNWVLIVAGSNGWYNYRHQVRGWNVRVPCACHVPSRPPPRVPLVNGWLWSCVPRPTPAMPTRSSTGTGSRTSRSWSWCMMTWHKTSSEFTLCLWFILQSCVLIFTFPDCKLQHTHFNFVIKLEVTQPLKYSLFT